MNNNINRHIVKALAQSLVGPLEDEDRDFEWNLKPLNIKLPMMGVGIPTFSAPKINIRIPKIPIPAQSHKAPTPSQPAQGKSLIKGQPFQSFGLQQSGSMGRYIPKAVAEEGGISHQEAIVNGTFWGTFLLGSGIWVQPAELLCSALVGRTVSINQTAAVYVAQGVGFAGAALSLYLGFSLPLQSATLAQRVGVINYSAVGAIIPPSMLPYLAPPENTFCSALPTEHSAETEVWREKLIKAADHNIILSGNFCAGVYFRKVLSQIEAQIKAKPHLQVIVIASPGILNAKDWEKVNSLQTKYPNNFVLVESPDEFVKYSDEIKKTGNHTKCLVIDSGKYYMLGGSGIKQNFTATGEDNFSKAQYLQKLGQKTRAEQTEKQGSFIAARINPVGGWRDGDFVFCSANEDPAGKYVYQQMLLLAFKYEAWKRVQRGEPAINLREGNLAFINGEERNTEAKRGYNQNLLTQMKTATGTLFIDPMLFDQTETMQKAVADARGRGLKILPSTEKKGSVVEHLLQTPMIPMGDIKTRIDAFHQDSKVQTKLPFKLLCTGPDMKENIYAKTVISHIKKAKKRIMINHMYFHPSEEVLKELISAANRGVRIQIISNGPYGQCQSRTATMTYRAKSRSMYEQLLQGAKDKSRVEFFEYNQEMSAYHKKVIVIDDAVIAGSSNFGYKSLGPMSDHELNFVIESPSFAKETLKISKRDRELSKPTQEIRMIDHGWLQGFVKGYEETKVFVG